MTSNPALDTIHVPGDGLRVDDNATLLTVSQLTARLRTINDGTGQVPAWQKDAVHLPTRGDRVAPLFRIVSQVNPAVAVGEETTRTEAAAPTPYGTDLPESAMGYTKALVPDRRFGAFMPLDKSVLSDSAALDQAASFLLDVDTARSIDAQLLGGNNTGENFDGLSSQGLATQALSTDARWQAFVHAAATVRGADWTSPITHVIHPVDAASLALEKTTQGAPVIADALVALRLMNADTFVISSLVAQGTAYTGAFAEGGTIYVREPATIEASSEHDDFFRKGIVVLRVDTRLGFKLHFKSAFVEVTGL